MLEIFLDLALLGPAVKQHVGLAVLLAQEAAQTEEGNQENMLDDEQDRDELRFVLLGRWKELRHYWRGLAVGLERRLYEG